MAEPNKKGKSPEASKQLPPDQLVLDSIELFRGQREIWIRHDGVLYRLRITRRKKLILQK